MVISERNCTNDPYNYPTKRRKRLIIGKFGFRTADVKLRILLVVDLVRYNHT